MKKIIALALALIMALSMASVAFAVEFAGDDKNCTTTIEGKYAPGSVLTVTNWGKGGLKGYKLVEDFTTAGGNKDYKGASLIEDIEINKNKDSVVITLKESEKLLDDARAIKGEIKVVGKNDYVAATISVNITVNNNYVEVAGEKKAAKAIDISEELWYAGVDGNTVVVMDEDGGYVSFTDNYLKGVVKMDADEKTLTGIAVGVDADTQEAIEDALPEDFDAIEEYYEITGKGFKNEVAYTYKAYAEDPHYFYVWDGEGFTALDAKYDADEDVDAYVFAYTGAGVLVVTDAEIVLAAEEETKNPDTGANDVVGVAAALAVVSLVAAGAVSLKK